MSVHSSLPDRPLRESEVVSLNRSAEIELAVATEPNGPTAGVVVATDDWVKGLAFDGTWDDGFDGNWTVVESVPLDDAERYEGLQQCEDAVRVFLGEIEPAQAEDDDSDTAGDDDTANGEGDATDGEGGEANGDAVDDEGDDATDGEGDA